MAERIGFIGLGLMGKPMAYNLLKAEYQLTAFNRSRASVDQLVKEGAVPASGPREVAEHSDVVITMLPDAPDVEAVVLGPDGVLKGAHENLLIINMGTFSPLAAKRLAETAEQRGVYMLDAPVSGGDEGAKDATLSIMVGGRLSDFQRVQPILAVLGKTVTYCGPVGAGQTVKACNQVAVALIIGAISEALVLGAKAGVQPDIILQVLSGGIAQNRFMDLRGANMIQHRFEPGGRAALHLKDLRIIAQVAQQYNVVLPLTSMVEQLFTTLVANGNGNMDHSALLTVIESLSNYSIVQGQPENAGAG